MRNNVEEKVVVITLEFQALRHDSPTRFVKLRSGKNLE
jgi:hypothetical protein